MFAEDSGRGFSIEKCRFGIHDISRTELSSDSHLPRFNMPLELGLFLGAKKFGRTQGKGRVCLVFNRQKYRYQKFCSDIAGQDIESHQGKPQSAIKAVRDWLQVNRKGSPISIPDGRTIFKRYRRFLRELPELRHAAHLDQDEKLIFVDYQMLVIGWIAANEWRP